MRHEVRRARKKARAKNGMRRPQGWSETRWHSYLQALETRMRRYADNWVHPEDGRESNYTEEKNADLRKHLASIYAYEQMSPDERAKVFDPHSTTDSRAEMLQTTLAMGERARHVEDKSLSVPLVRREPEQPEPYDDSIEKARPSTLDGAIGDVIRKGRAVRVRQRSDKK